MPAILFSICSRERCLKTLEPRVCITNRCPVLLLPAGLSVLGPGEAVILCSAVRYKPGHGPSRTNANQQRRIHNDTLSRVSLSADVTASLTCGASSFLMECAQQPLQVNAPNTCGSFLEESTQSCVLVCG